MLAREGLGDNAHDLNPAATQQLGELKTELITRQSN
jgi:hypothetical protein